jgi:hypothetical protein
MEIPPWSHAISSLMYAAEMGGFLVGVWRWRSLGRGQKVITLWFGAAIGFDLLALALAPRLLNTQPISNTLYPISVVLALEALASYQVTRVFAIRFRLVAAAYVVTWAVLHLTVERLTDYSTFAAPLSGIVVLACAALVLFQRVARGRSDVLTDPAFLIAAGLCGCAVADVFRTLVAGLLLHDHPYYALAYYSACNLILTLAELIIIRALLVPAGHATRTVG